MVSQHIERQARTSSQAEIFRKLAYRVLTASTVLAQMTVIDYWMGHENPDMSTRYGKQLKEKVGLGFELPQVLGPQSNVNCATCATNSAEQACTANA